MEHKFQFCDHCDRMMVVCRSCGNNTCNGGFGEVIGPEKIDGEIVMISCTDCESAYELDKNFCEIFFRGTSCVRRGPPTPYNPVSTDCNPELKRMIATLSILKILK